MNISAIDLNLLPVLGALLRRRSVSQAARDLDLSQPAMSHALKRLRIALGDPLFVRTGRGVAPTARAEALAAPLSEILERVEVELLSPGKFDPAKSGRTFTLCLSDVGSFVLWPRIVSAVRAAAPGVRLDLRSVDAGRLGAALEAGEVDVAVGAYPGLSGALFQQRLFERDYVCLMREGHPLSRGRASARRFAAAGHVVVRAPSRIQERIDADLAARGLRRRGGDGNTRLPDLAAAGGKRRPGGGGAGPACRGLRRARPPRKPRVAARPAVDHGAPALAQARARRCRQRVVARCAQRPVPRGGRGGRCGQAC